MERRGRTALVFAALCALLVAVGAVSSAGAAKTKTIGKTKHTPAPSCPGNECQVLGEVTGFQVGADNKDHGLMKIRKSGSIVAWSVDLSKPSKNQRKNFAKILGDRGFNGDPTARLAILKKADKKKYKLKKQSPTMNLSGYYNQQAYFTLNDPLKVQKGWIVGLTTRTWVPNFAHEHLSNHDVWKASRKPGKCTKFNDLTEHSKPQEKVGDVRKYGCTYRGARLDYWAYLAPG